MINLDRESRNQARRIGGAILLKTVSELQVDAISN